MSDENKNKAVLILGSGATAGSEIKFNDKLLPTDNDFFKESTAKKFGARSFLGKELAFPALTILFDEIFDKNTAFTKDTGLYSVWNNIFVLRGLGRSEILRFKPEMKDKYDSLKNHSWPKNYRYQKENYENFFSIEDRYLPYEYALTELAIWDLRVMVKKVYGECAQSSSVAKKLWEGAYP